MDLEDVRIFTKVVEAGSFTEAASGLGLPKSTVSRRVSELEDALNVRLLQRTTRKLSLTHAGEIYFNRTSRLIAELKEAELAVQELQDEPRGVLRVTIPPDLSDTMSGLVSAFQDRYPLVELAVFSTARRVDLVAEGFDLALRAGTLDDSSLVSRKLLDIPFALFASCKYIKKHGNPSAPEELTHHSCLAFSSERTHSTWRLNGPAGEVSIAVSGPIATNDLRLIQSLVQAGRGIAFLPHISNEAARTKGIQRVLCDYLGATHGFYVVYPSARHLSPRVRAFIDFSIPWLTAMELLA